MSLYKSGWFQLQDLVPQSVFNYCGNCGWELLDERLLITLDRMRVIYGPILINDWAYGGEVHWNGLRTTECPFYNMYSQHSFGRAANIKFENFSIAEVKNDILNGSALKEFEYITTIMTDKGYLHIDVRNGERFTVLLP